VKTLGRSTYSHEEIGFDPDRLYVISAEPGILGDAAREEEGNRLLRFFKVPMSPGYLLKEAGRLFPDRKTAMRMLADCIARKMIKPVDGVPLQTTVDTAKWNFYRDIDEHSSAAEVQVNITNRCVNRCRMCRKYEWEQAEMPAERIAGLAGELRRMGDPLVILSGGEPFLHREIDRVLEIVADMRTLVFTSGTVPVSAGKFQKLKRVQFSVDALDPEIYRAIRGPGSVEVLKENIVRAKEAGCLVTITSVMQRENILHIPDIMEFCEAEGVPFLPGAVHSYNELAFYDLSRRPLPRLCLVPFYHCLVDPSGDVFVCCHHYEDNTDYRNIDRRFVLGNAFEEGFASVWHSAGAREIKRWLLDNRAAFCQGCFRYLLENDVASHIRASDRPVDLPYLHTYFFPLEIMKRSTAGGR
jgi:MoaA/NifB/PqqE/SkfB family radical SAM enzyme